MDETTLSVFVDESGRFQHPDPSSRFYIVGMVFHDQRVDVSKLIDDFDRSIAELGLDHEAFVFHAGPLIRKEKGYEYLTRKMRGRIYRRMMTFARKVDVFSKGIGSLGTLEMEPSGGKVAVYANLVVPFSAEPITFTGGSGSKYLTYLSSQMDGDDQTQYVWSDHLAAHPDGAYCISKATYIRADSSLKFKGGSLEIANGSVQVGVDQTSLTVSNLLVDAAGIFYLQNRKDTTEPWLTPLRGNAWTVNGILRVYQTLPLSHFSLDVPLAGTGEVHVGGWNDKKRELTETTCGRVTGDNSAFRGKFVLNQFCEKDGVNYPRGVEITRGEALGGDQVQLTADGVDVRAHNGIVALETLTLSAKNRGVKMAANTFLSVAAEKTMTLAQPLRIVSGLRKDGDGTLALGASDISFGEDGAAAADGVVNAFRVAAGAVRPTGSANLGKLKTTFASGAALELDLTETADDVKADGFCQPLGVTVEGATLPVSVVYPDGFELQPSQRLVLATVPAREAQVLADKMVVRVRRGKARPLVVEPAGDGRARIVAEIYRSGFVLIYK